MIFKEKIEYNYMEKYEELNQYLRSKEPDAKERAAIWQTAIGMQKVDGLTVSDYLMDTAQKHIENQVNIDEAKALITEYYQAANRREDTSNDEEADKASVNIVQVLSEQAFSFSVEGFAGLHRRIFQGVFSHAGEFRDYNITKKEWVLDGETVIYGPCEDLRQTIQYDLDQEKQFKYKGMPMEKVIKHFSEFIAGLWQIHPFREGNTRTTAVFAIKYLRTLGLHVENDMFKQHSWYFRNALVRANYRNVMRGIDPTTIYLELFFRNLLLGETNYLQNRSLHVSNNGMN
jgi:fido (protein-threonine AMPylation protein)